MQVCDFGRSFLTFRIDLEKKPPITMSHKPAVTLNNARIQLECRCRIANVDGDQSTEYVLGASCKTEKVNVERDIWTQPNADFCPVVSQDRFLLIKRWDRCNKGVMLYPPSLGEQPQRQVGASTEAWESLRIDVYMTEGRVLQTTEQVLEAVLDNRPIVSQTEFDTSDGKRVLLEYPVKTINAGEREGFYQIDTGPVLLPDVSGDAGSIDGLRLAFVAHNAPDWAEFVVNVPTPVSDGIEVHHYSRSVRLETTNRMIEIRNNM